MKKQKIISILTLCTIITTMANTGVKATPNNNLEKTVLSESNNREVATIDHGAVSQTWNIGKSTPTNVVATLYSDGFLDIQGTGEITSYVSTTQPWRDLAVTANVGKGITGDISMLFSRCSKLVSANIESDSIKKMRATFKGCPELVSVTRFPEGVTDIANCFIDDVKLVSVATIPNSVTTLESTFEGCTSFKVLSNIPTSCITMNTTCSGCTSLISIPDIQPGVKNMSNAFKNCSSLTQALKILDGDLTTLNQTVFVGSGITQIYLNPSKLQTFVDLIRASYPTIQLYDINTNQSLPSYTADVSLKGDNTVKIEINNGVAKISGKGDLQNFKESAIPWNDRKASIKEVVIDVGVSGKADYYFKGCANLEKVTINTDDISDLYATFGDCTKLTSINKLPNKLINLSYCFDGCSLLSNIPELPNGLRKMFNSFCGTNISMPPAIPSTVIAASAAFSGCKELKQPAVFPENCNVNTGFSDGLYENCSKLENPGKIPYGTKSISHFYYGCSLITEMPDIPNTVIEARGAFAKTGISRVTSVPKGDISGLFADCSKLTGVLTLPEGINVLPKGDRLITGTGITTLILSTKGQEEYIQGLKESNPTVKVIDSGEYEFYKDVPEYKIVVDAIDKGDLESFLNAYVKVKMMPLSDKRTGLEGLLNNTFTATENVKTNEDIHKDFNRIITYSNKSTVMSKQDCIALSKLISNIVLQNELADKIGANATDPELAYSVTDYVERVNSTQNNIKHDLTQLNSLSSEGDEILFSLKQSDTAPATISMFRMARAAEPSTLEGKVEKAKTSVDTEITQINTLQEKVNNTGSTWADVKPTYKQVNTLIPSAEKTKMKTQLWDTLTTSFASLNETETQTVFTDIKNEIANDGLEKSDGLDIAMLLPEGSTKDTIMNDINKIPSGTFTPADDVNGTVSIEFKPKATEPGGGDTPSKGSLVLTLDKGTISYDNELISVGNDLNQTLGIKVESDANYKVNIKRDAFLNDSLEIDSDILQGSLNLNDFTGVKTYKSIDKISSEFANNSPGAHNYLLSLKLKNSSSFNFDKSKNYKTNLNIEATQK